MKIITLLMVTYFFLSSNAFAHVKTLYSDKGITTYCVDGMKFAVADGVGIVQVMENRENHAVPRMCSMK
mgnify:CR=1 FL=1